MIETAILTAWPALQAGGPWVFVALAGFFLLTGRLVTIRAHERALADLRSHHAQAIEDLRSGHNDRVEDLRAIIATQDQTVAALLRQKDDLLAGARVSQRALEAIRRQSEIGGGDDAMVA